MSAATAGEQIAKTIPALLPIISIRFITALRYPYHLIDDCYSSIGPTLQLAAETVDSRLRRPTTCSRIASFFEVAVRCAGTSTRPLSLKPFLSTRRGLRVRCAGAF